MRVPARGDIIYLDFNPQAGTEQAGRRPALVISPEKFNRVTGYAAVCPITRSQRKWGFHIPIPAGLDVEGVIIADQIKNLDWKTRNAEIKEKAPKDLVNKVVQVVHMYVYEEYEERNGGF